MSKIINIIKSLEKPSTINEVAVKLNLRWFEVLELIGKVHKIEPGLITSNENNQYYTTCQLSWLDSGIMNKQLKEIQHDDYQIKIIPELNSTNTYVLEHLNQLSNKSVIVTELQTRGRGRANNRWISRLGVDVTASVLYLFEEHYNFELFPLIVAVALNRLYKQFKINNKIKWPNDIYQNEKHKIAGILVESGISRGKRFIVIGIGLDNINNIDRNQFLVQLIRNLDNVVREYSSLGFATFRREWLDNCIHFKQKVALYRDGRLLCSGENIDLTLDGELVVKTSSEIKKFISSNVSLNFGEWK